MRRVWAIPGANSIIDAINPETGLTLVCGNDASAVLARHPNAIQMSWDEWQAAAIARQQTPIEWQEETEAKFMEMLEVLPPALQVAGGFLVGEPWDHDFETGAPRFEAHVERNGRFYVASRPLTRKDFRKELGR